MDMAVFETRACVRVPFMRASYYIGGGLKSDPNSENYPYGRGYSTLVETLWKTFADLFK